MMISNVEDEIIQCGSNVWLEDVEGLTRLWVHTTHFERICFAVSGLHSIEGIPHGQPKAIVRRSSR